MRSDILIFMVLGFMFKLSDIVMVIKRPKEPIFLRLNTYTYNKHL